MPNPLGMYSEKYVGRHVCVELWDSGEGTQYYVGEVQELSVEPAQEIHEIDGLCSDEVYRWAFGLKTFRGSIKEPFKTKAQLMNMAPFQTTHQEYVMKVELDTGVAGEENILKFHGVIFPGGSIPMPKNEPVFLTREWRARTVETTEA